MRFARKLAPLLRSQPLSLRREEDRARMRTPHGPQGAHHGLRLEHHPRTSPIGPVVHTAMLPLRKVADVDMANGEQPPFACPTQHALVKGPSKITRKEREDVDLHYWAPAASRLFLRAARFFAVTFA